MGYTCLSALIVSPSSLSVRPLRVCSSILLPLRLIDGMWHGMACTPCMCRGYPINNPKPLIRQRFNHVFHQVRHPLRVIATIVRYPSTLR